MYEPLQPARLAYTEYGGPYSETYGDVYHPIDGAPGQARHVFLAGNRLPERWRDRERFVILETGFGSGLNFLATWAAWQADPAACLHLHYISAEKHPFSTDDLARLHAAWPEYGDFAARLRAAWPTLVPGFHRIHFCAGRLTLTLLLGDASATLPRLVAGVDAFYLDGFSPARNPAIWAPALIAQLGRLANRDATLSTWSVSVPVRDSLRAAGFETAKAPGFGHKREMLVGRLVESRPPTATPERRAIVVGAGVAGSTACERLASRGWRVILLERQPGPGREASGNLAGILMPMISRDDNIASRLSRAAFLYALRSWGGPEARGAGARLLEGGVFQIARTPEQERQQREIVEALALPDAFIRYLPRSQAESRLGHALPAGGWLFPQAGWANPPSLCQAALALAGDRIEARFGQAAASAERSDGQWRVLADDGRCLAEAPVLVLAGGADAGRFAQAAPLPIRRVRGQVTLVPEARMPDLTAALCRDGYATPALDGRHAVGASYDLDDDPLPRRACDDDNLRRLADLLPGVELAGEAFQARVGFRPVLPDRLPIAGALPDWPALPTSTAARLSDLRRQPGLYGLLGYASRGLVWANLLAEALVSGLEGEPMPLETDLLGAIDPARFALRAIRKGA
jgi:tRNA 5-methylaminomethyl-2-thiouridine biosynthesis bifunctional protein